MLEIANPENFRKTKIGKDHYCSNESTPQNISDELLDNILDVEFIKREKHLFNEQAKRQARKEARESKRREESLTLTQEFCEEVSCDFIGLLLEEHENDNNEPRLSESTIQHIINNDIALPRFNIILGKDRREILKRICLKQKISSDSIVLIFRLPELLDTSDIKDEEQEFKLGNTRKENGEMWGYLYNSLKTTVWVKIHEYEKEKGLRFRRLNPKRQHDPVEYYYVWEVEKSPRNSTLSNNQLHS